MATYDLRKKSEVSTGQRKKPFFGQTVSLEAFDELEKKVLKQDKKLDKILDPGIPRVGFSYLSLLALRFGIFRPQIRIPHEKLYI